jgi:hypothetical protein
MPPVSLTFFPSHLCVGEAQFEHFDYLLSKISAEPEFDFLKHGVGIVVSQISNNGQQPVFLAVDELMKSGTLGDPIALLSKIGMALDSQPYFHTLVTSLDPEVVREITANSGRPIDWLPLSPLSFKHSINALAKHELKFQVSKGTTEDLRSCRPACAIIADCNGHPRSLEMALDLLKPYSINHSDEVLPSSSCLLAHGSLITMSSLFTDQQPVTCGV